MLKVRASSPKASIFTGLITLSLLLSSAGATQMLPYTLEELYQAADLVFLGKVRGEESHVEGGRIWTRYALDPLQQVKRSPSYSAALWRLGGTAHGVTQRVHGAPVLQIGAHYLFFLRCGPRRCKAVGMSQGILIATKDQDPLLSPLPEARDLSLPHQVQGERAHQPLTQTPARWSQPLRLTALIEQLQGRFSLNPSDSRPGSEERQRVSE
ncbi:MAG: hypothetical protein VYD19_06285 [Myxococcota bacterium]|nr:hypothetical protein [Myxococcota bacterium]